MCKKLLQLIQVLTFRGEDDHKPLTVQKIILKIVWRAKDELITECDWKHNADCQSHSIKIQELT